MKCCNMVSGLAVGMMVGAAAVLMLPSRRTSGMKRQMKHTVQDIENVMEDAMEGICAILCN